MNNRPILGTFILIFGLVFVGVLFSNFVRTSVPSSDVLSSQAQKTQPTKKPSLVPSVSSPQISGMAYETSRVTRVVDGDTIKLTNGKTLRYIGINTPETKDPRKTVECFGKEASLQNQKLVEGKEVRLVKDVSETDRYGRLLRYVYIVDPSTSSGKIIFVNDYLARQGFAYATSYPPDIKFQSQFRKAQKEAQQNKRGLWGICK